MVSRRERILDAAVRLLAQDGARSLTHRAVDAAAGLPAGSTSNVFRTRAALVAGILTLISERERAILTGLASEGEPRVVTEESLVELAAAVLHAALGRGRPATLARRALFTEASRAPAVAAQLEQATRYWWDLTSGLLRPLGVPDSDRRARWLLAYLDGIISDQLARPQPDFDPTAALAPAVYGIVHLPG